MAGVLWVASASKGLIGVLPGQGCFAWSVGVLSCSGFLDRLCMVVGLGARRSGEGEGAVTGAGRVGCGGVAVVAGLVACGS